MPKISELTLLTGAGTATNDLYAIVDVSAAETKGQTVAEAKIALGLPSYTPLAGGTMTGLLTLSGDPASALQAVTKQYVDGIAVNLGKRQTVRVATTGNVVISTALNSGDAIDGVTLATNDLVLVRDQSTPAQNGIYVVDVSPVRSTEFDTYDEHPGALIVAEEGTVNALTTWLCTSNAGGTLNTTPLVFTQSATTYSAGTGLTLAGTDFSIDGAVVGRLATANTWALAQTFTTAPVFTDGSGTRTALGLAIGTNVQAYDADLAALAGLTSAADKGIQFTGSGTAATYDLTAAGKALLDDADATAQRVTLGLVIGTNVQAYDADLDAIAGLTSAADKGIQFTGSGTAATYDLTTAGKALLDDASAAAQRTTLGLSNGGILAVIDGGGSTITTGLKGYLGPMPFGGTITEATLIANASGSIVVDVWKCTYSDFDAGSTHPVVGDKITASAPPTISTATKSQDATLTGWTTAFSAGDILAFNVNSVTDIERVDLSLKFTK